MGKRWCWLGGGLGEIPAASAGMTDLILRGYDGSLKCEQELALGFDGGLEGGDDFGAAALEAELAHCFG